MRRIVIVIISVLLLTGPVRATEFTPPEVPDDVEYLMPDETTSFGEGLWYILSKSLERFQPSFMNAIRICISIIFVSLLVGLFSELTSNVRSTIGLVGTITIGVLLFRPVNTFIQLGTETVKQISQYGNLLLPVMSGALAAQGAITKSSAVYAATVLFDTFLSRAVAQLLIPLVYVYLCLSVICNVFLQPLLMQMMKFIKWVMTWGLKIVLYIFTGYISITGVVGGTTDAAMLKATKLTISGMVPVVGNIISDASEAILVSAGLMKNAVGIYGLLAIVSIWIGPFLQIGIQYILLKLTSGICEMFAVKQISGLIKDFTGAMGLVLAMTGSVCLMFLISTICFMKGVA